MSKKSICAICKELKKMSKEHNPPRKSGNFGDKRISIYIDYLQQYRMVKRTNGISFETICKNCNNNTGEWYGKKFIDFVLNFKYFYGNTFPPKEDIYFNYQFCPLNVYKQIITMFISLPGNKHLNADDEFKNFLLNKECNILSDKYKVYMYRKIPSNSFIYFSQMLQYSPNGMCHFSEISHNPFGYVLSIDNNIPEIEGILNIDFFKQYKYNESISHILQLPFIEAYNALGTKECLMEMMNIKF